MNSHQRRKNKRAGLRMSRHLVAILYDALDELESGKSTIPEIRKGLDGMKDDLAKMR
tara:strand:- start:1087 stop:1257 length:171 start_codon:yes stop_codon:yes gene_type:complete